MTRDRLLAVLAGSVIGASVLGQAVPICCRYAYTAWGDGPSGPCSGETASYCEEGYPTSPDPDDPLAMLRKPGTRAAQCCVVDVGTTGYFVHSECDGGPPTPGAVLVGQLPSGTCCWAVEGNGPLVIECTDQAYSVKKCETDCPEVPA
jgi:hypothetical protein